MTETATMTLTAIDIKALKQADHISWHHSPADGGKLVATKRNRNPGPFDERERRYPIDVLSTFSGKHADGTQAEPGNSSCSYHTADRVSP